MCKIPFDFVPLYYKIKKLRLESSILFPTSGKGGGGEEDRNPSAGVLGEESSFKNFVTV